MIPRADRLTYTMDVVLHAGRKVVVDDLAHALEVHASGHDVRCHHDPAFAPPHPADRVLAPFHAQSCMKTVNMGDAVEDELFGEGGSAGLRGGEYQNGRVVWACEVGEETWKFGLLVRDVCE